MKSSIEPTSIRMLVLVPAFLMVFTGEGRAQPTLCDPDAPPIDPYTVARIHADNDATASDVIHIRINGDALPLVPTGASFTDDEVILAIFNTIDSVMCSAGGPCPGRKRFTVATVGETTLLVTGDRERQSFIDAFSMYCENDGGFFLNWQLVEMPALIIDFDPKNPMGGGFDVDTTEATGDSGEGASIVGNRDTSGFTFTFNAISGLQDQALATAFMDSILGDPAGYCLTGARSGFALLREGDLPILEGVLILQDETMLGVAVVPPVIGGVTPDLIDPGGGGMMTVRGYNMLDNDNFNGVLPNVEIGGVDVGPVTAVNSFTLEFPIPAGLDGEIQDIAVLAPWGRATSFDRVAYTNRPEVRCRMSTVNATARTTLEPFSLSFDSLFVNGSSGDGLNEITLLRSGILTIEMVAPPTLPGGAAFTLWIDLGNSNFEPGPGDITPRGMNGSQGSTCRPFNPAASTFIQTAPRAIVLNFPIASRLNGPRNLYLQGLIRDDASNDLGGGPTMSVTNGILVRIVD